MMMEKMTRRIGGLGQRLELMESRLHPSTIREGMNERQRERESEQMITKKMMK